MHIPNYQLYVEVKTLVQHVKDPPWHLAIHRQLLVDAKVFSAETYSTGLYPGSVKLPPAAGVVHLDRYSGSSCEGGVAQGTGQNLSIKSDHRLERICLVFII